MKMYLSLLLLAFAYGSNGFEYCAQGPPGQAGTPGTPGTPGTGTPGQAGPSGCPWPRRWKQCAWTYDDTRDNKDSGVLHECDFVKLRADTYLRVVYMGNIRITGCESCCKRWYFTFNNTECNNPATIDGSLYQATNLNIHRPTNIEGYCGEMTAGKVRVRFNIGDCGGGYNTGDAWTSWNQANRIIIEEVEPPVA